MSFFDKKKNSSMLLVQNRDKKLHKREKYENIKPHPFCLAEIIDGPKFEHFFWGQKAKNACFSALKSIFMQLYVICEFQ